MAAICDDKRESIRGATSCIWGLIRQWRKDDKIDDQDAALMAVYLRKIETCVMLDTEYDRKPDD